MSPRRCPIRQSSQSATFTPTRYTSLTRYLLRLVPSDSADDRVLLPGDAVHRALGVALHLRGHELGLAFGVLALAGALQGVVPGDFADGLDDVALGGVESAFGLSVGGFQNACEQRPRGGETYVGPEEVLLWLLLWEDMGFVERVGVRMDLGIGGCM